MTEDLSVYSFRPSSRFVMLFALAIVALAIFGFVRGVMEAGGIGFGHAASASGVQEEVRPPEAKTQNLPKSSVFTPPVVPAAPSTSAVEPAAKTEPAPPGATAAPATAAPAPAPAAKNTARETVVPSPVAAPEPRAEAPPPVEPAPKATSPQQDSSSLKGLY